jgi:hypothetical protein
MIWATGIVSGSEQKSLELGYFGEVFDRPSNVPLPWFDEGADTNADMWATAEESQDGRRQ